MKLSECSHIRIRNNNFHDVDVEKFITSLERQYKIDFTALPQWKEIIKRLHVTTTDYKRMIQEAKRRKYVIMSKIYIESTRDSPFTLTDKLARTHKKWETIESARERSRQVVSSRQKFSNVILSSLTNEEINGEISENTDPVHHNTEIQSFTIESLSKPDTDFETEVTDIDSHLPVKICVNEHKLISPLNSQEAIFDNLTSVGIHSCEVLKADRGKNKEWSMLNQTKSLKCFPEEVFITKTTLNEQVIKFSITNCSTESMNVKFICLSDYLVFKTAKVFPATPVKLYPGVAFTYQFVFKLCENTDDFSSMLYFRVGQRALKKTSLEALCIPISSKFKRSRLVSVNKTVSTPPTYLWQMNKISGFPSGVLNISCNDKYSYHVHLIKSMDNILSESQDSNASLGVISPNTESFKDREEDNDMITESKMLASFREENILPITTWDVITLVVNDLVDLALDTFVFDHTYIFLKPHSKASIDVQFKNPEHIGSHHCYYDLHFSDTRNEEVFMTKIVKVFAEVLPHPVQIYPNILDMSKSPVHHGFCEDDITITNTHKVYPVTVKFELTAKMRKLFSITPMYSLIPPKSNMSFRVRTCSTDLSKGCDELVHFTIKIIVIGHTSVYYNVPPFYYEIIAPCASEFKKIYDFKCIEDSKSST